MRPKTANSCQSKESFGLGLQPRIYIRTCTYRLENSHSDWIWVLQKPASVRRQKPLRCSLSVVWEAAGARHWKIRYSLLASGQGSLACRRPVAALAMPWREACGSPPDRCRGRWQRRSFASWVREARRDIDDLYSFSHSAYMAGLAID